MINYELVSFESLTTSDNKWEAIRVSNVEDYGKLVDLIQDPSVELWKYNKNSDVPEEKKYIF